MLGCAGGRQGDAGPWLARDRAIPKSRPATSSAKPVQARSELGLRAKAIMDRGELVSDEVEIGIVKERLDRPMRPTVHSRRFPRTWRRRSRSTGSQGRRAHRVEIDVPEAELVQRLGARWSAPPAASTPRRIRGGVVRRGGEAAADRSCSAPTTARRSYASGSTCTAQDDALAGLLPRAADVPLDQRGAGTRSRGGGAGRGRRCPEGDGRPEGRADDCLQVRGRASSGCARPVAWWARSCRAGGRRWRRASTRRSLDEWAEKRIARAGATAAFKGYHGYRRRSARRSTTR